MSCLKLKERQTDGHQEDSQVINSLRKPSTLAIIHSSQSSSYHLGEGEGEKEEHDFMVHHLPRLFPREFRLIKKLFGMSRSVGRAIGEKRARNPGPRPHILFPQATTKSRCIPVQSSRGERGSDSKCLCRVHAKTNLDSRSISLNSTLDQVTHQTQKLLSPAILVEEDEDWEEEDGWRDLCSSTCGWLFCSLRTLLGSKPQVMADNLAHWPRLVKSVSPLANVDKMLGMSQDYHLEKAGRCRLGSKSTHTLSDGEARLGTTHWYFM